MTTSKFSHSCHSAQVEWNKVFCTFRYVDKKYKHQRTVFCVCRDCKGQQCCTGYFRKTNAWVDGKRWVNISMNYECELYGKICEETIVCGRCFYELWMWIVWKDMWDNNLNVVDLELLRVKEPTASGVETVTEERKKKTTRRKGGFV